MIFKPFMKKLSIIRLLSRNTYRQLGCKLCSIELQHFQLKSNVWIHGLGWIHYLWHPPAQTPFPWACSIGSEYAGRFEMHGLLSCEGAPECVLWECPLVSHNLHNRQHSDGLTGGNSLDTWVRRKKIIIRNEEKDW